MNRKDCPTEAELLCFVDLDLAPENLQKIEQHLQDCPACTAQVEELRQVIADVRAPFSAPMSEPEVAQHVHSVLQRIEASPVRKTRRFGVAQAAALGTFAAAAGFLLFLRAGDDVSGGEWTARGGPRDDAGSESAVFSRDVGVQVYGGRERLLPLAPGDTVAAKIAFSVGVRNLGSKPVYLLLFAVDSKQVVHWIAPEYTQPDVLPTAVPIPVSATEQLLPTSVVFDDLAPGPAQLIAILQSTPSDISAVEKMTPAELSAGRFVERFPNTEVRQFTVEVRP